MLPGAHTPLHVTHFPDCRNQQITNTEMCTRDICDGGYTHVQLAEPNPAYNQILDATVEGFKHLIVGIHQISSSKITRETSTHVAQVTPT